MNCGKTSWHDLFKICSDLCRHFLVKYKTVNNLMVSETPNDTRRKVTQTGRCEHRCFNPFFTISYFSKLSFLYRYCTQCTCSTLLEQLFQKDNYCNVIRFLHSSNRCFRKFYICVQNCTVYLYIMNSCLSKIINVERNLQSKNSCFEKDD